MQKKLFLKKVIAHRGACGYAPENTLAAMRKAYELGMHWVEFDVMLTADQQAIIMHDETLERTTNGKGEVAKTTLADIQKLDAGSWFAKQFADQHVPTFAELLRYLQTMHMQINVEIKPTIGKEIITAEKTIEELQRIWPIAKSLPLVSSAKEQALQIAYKMNPQLPLGFITDHWLNDWQEKLRELHCISLHIHHEVLTEEKVAAVKAANYLVLAYTINDAARATQLFSWGVDAVFSDFPDRILPVID